MYTLPAEVMPTLQAHRACEHTVLAQDAGNFHDLEKLLFTADISSGTSITQRKTLSHHDLLFSGSLQPRKLWWKRKWGCQEFGSSLLIPLPHIRLASVYIKEPEIIPFSVPISARNVKWAPQHLLALLSGGHKVRKTKFGLTNVY